MFKLSTEDLKIYILERVSRLGNINIKEYNFLENKHVSATVVKCWKIPIRKCRFSNIFLR